MIKLKGNFKEDAFNYAQKYLTLETQIQTHWAIFPKKTVVDFSGIPEGIRAFNELDKIFKERYFPQYKPFEFFPLGANPLFRTAYYFPFEIITPINCSYILNEIKITG